MTRLPHLAQRMFNRPVAILPEKSEMIVAALADRFGITHLFGAGPTIRVGAPSRGAFDDDEYGLGGPARQRPPYEVVAGVAIIEVEGTLVQKTGCLHPYSGMTGYDGLRQLLAMALADGAVQAVMLDINSPGGEVAGCFDLVDAIYASRGSKPIWAVLDEMACSAAYAIASACDRVTIPRTGDAGSVGVIAMHADFSKALAAEGIAITIIKHGAHKADGNPYEPLPEDVLKRFQADIDRVGALFSATVARNRGLDVRRVESWQALTFMGEAAVTEGLADEVMAPDAAFRALVASLPKAA